MIGKIIREKREEKGITQQELADLIGCSKQTVWRWEKNKSGISPNYYKKLKQILGISIEELL